MIKEHNTEDKEKALHIGGVNCWHSWHEHPKENSEIDVMWSDNSIDRLKYTLRGYNDLDFKTTPIPIKWRYACS